MKTTLDLPDELIRAIKIRAAERNLKLEDLIASLLRSGLSQQSESPKKVRRRVKFPLVNCRHEARPGEEMTPERLAEVLADEEARDHGVSGR